MFRPGRAEARFARQGRELGKALASEFQHAGRQEFTTLGWLLESAGRISPFILERVIAVILDMARASKGRSHFAYATTSRLKEIKHRPGLEPAERRAIIVLDYLERLQHARPAHV